MHSLAFMLIHALLQAPQVQSAALRATQEAIVSTVDASLPAVTLETWLQQQLGPQVQISWEVNDCGEQTGTSADAGRDLPFCVEARAELRDHRTLTMSFFAGTTRTGLGTTPLKIFFGELATSPSEHAAIRELRDLPRLLPPQRR